MEGYFTNLDQLCVFKIIFSEVDPIDVLDELKMSVDKLQSVQAQVFS